MEESIYISSFKTNSVDHNWRERSIDREAAK